MKCGTYGENVFPDEDCVVDRVKHTHHHHVAILLHTYLPHVGLERLDYRLPHLPSQEQTSETNGQSIAILQGIVYLWTIETWQSERDLDQPDSSI